MAKYIVDANLPQTFNFWQTDDFVYAISLGINCDDNEIWEYAKQNNLTILTRDNDFADRIIHFEPPPKVIQFKTGNMRFPHFRNFIKDNWDKISFYNHNYKLVLVYSNSIEGIK